MTPECLGLHGRFRVGVGGILIHMQLLGDHAAEEHGESAQIDDDAGDQVRDLGGEILGRQEAAAYRDVGDKDRGEDGSDGVGGCQQSGGDAVEAHGRQAGGVQGVPFGTRRQIQQARAETGQRTGDGHGQDDVFLLVDTGIAGGVLVQAHRLELIAEGGLFQNDPDQDSRRNGQEDGDGGAGRVEQIGHAAGRDQGLRRTLGHLPGTGVVGVVHGTGAPGVDDLVDHIQADPVEHDGGDDLIDVQVRFEDAGNGAPHRAEQGRRQQADIPGQIEDQGAVQAAEGTQGVLPCRTNVEQAGLEGKRYRKAGHDQGC